MEYNEFSLYYTVCNRKSNKQIFRTYFVLTTGTTNVFQYNIITILKTCVRQLDGIEINAIKHKLCGFKPLGLALVNPVSNSV